MPRRATGTPSDGRAGSSHQEPDKQEDQGHDGQAEIRLRRLVSQAREWEGSGDESEHECPQAVDLSVRCIPPDC